MGVLIFLGIVGLVVYCVADGCSAPASSPTTKAKDLSDVNPFSVRLVKEKLQLESGGSIDALSIQVKGIINSGDQTLEDDRAFLGSMLLSSSEAENKESPVLCAIEDLQAKDTPIFSHVSDHLSTAYGLAGGWDEWVSVVSAPIAALTFNRTGSLRVKLRLKVFYQLSNASVEKVATLGYYNPHNGYLDSFEQRKRGKELAVSLAVLVAGIDGVRDAAEAEIVTGFIRKQITLIEDEADQAVAKQRLNKAAKEAHAIHTHPAIRTRGFELADEAAKFDSDIKFQIMELLLDVAGADDIAAKHETDFLNDLAHRMGLDIDEYKNMRDKALPISIYETNSDAGAGQMEGMLGLTAGMSVAEKKSQLSKEYRKWNALKNSSDPVKSKQAKDMVKVISELRKSL
jgi:hypothetical protein